MPAFDTCYLPALYLPAVARTVPACLCPTLPHTPLPYCPILPLFVILPGTGLGRVVPATHHVFPFACTLPHPTVTATCPTPCMPFPLTHPIACLFAPFAPVPRLELTPPQHACLPITCLPATFYPDLPISAHHHVFPTHNFPTLCSTLPVYYLLLFLPVYFLFPPFSHFCTFCCRHAGQLSVTGLLLVRLR